MNTNTPSLGCSFLSTCINISTYSNITMQTVGTGFTVYNPTSFLYGFNLMVTDYDPVGSYGINFDITTTTLNSDTYKSTFSYSGSTPKQFIARYTYLIIL